MIPIWAAIAGLLMVLVPVALAAYSFGWYWRGKHAPRVTVRKVTNTTMTPEQQKSFDQAFVHMGKAFEEVGKVFK